MSKIASLFAIMLVVAWASIARGQNFWEQVNGSLYGTVSVMAFDSSGSVYAGTYGGGIFRSSNSGKTWVSLDSAFYAAGGNSSIESVAAGPGGRVYASCIGGNGALYSTDKGTTWSLLNPHPAFQLAVSKAGTLFATVGHGLSRWDSLSRVWIPILNTVTPPILAPNGRLFVRFNDTLLVSYEGTSWQVASFTCPQYAPFTFDNHGNLFILTDSGALQLDTSTRQWLHYPTQYPLTLVSSFTSDRSGNFLAVLLRPDKKHGLFKSLNKGESWQPLLLSDSGDAGIVRANVAPNGDYYATSEVLGLLCSYDGGMTWTASQNGITDIQSQIVTIAATRKGNVLTATEMGGGYRTADEGATWIPIDSTLIEGFRTLAVSPSGRILRGTETGILISDDEGRTWTKTFSLQNLLVCSFGCGPDSVLYAATDGAGVLQSTDNGLDWHVLYSSPSYYLSSIAVTPTGDVFVLSLGLTLYRSTNRGLSWSNAVPQSSTVDAVGITKSGKVLASTEDEGLLASTNNGKTWNQISSNLVLARFTLNPQGAIFAVSSSGLASSSDDGSDWQAVPSSQFPNKQITAIACDSMSQLYLGIGYPYGIYRSVNSTYEAQGDVRDKAWGLTCASVLTQNSPNPFPESTSISFTLPAPGYTSLTLFDVTGREVRRIASGYFSAGEHTVAFSRGTLPAGAYFYRLETGGSSQTRAMIIE